MSIPPMRPFVSPERDRGHDQGIDLVAHSLDFVTERRAMVIPTVWDVPSAVAARDAGAEALMLSGSAFAATVGMPDLGLMSREQIVGAAASIVRAVELPLMVDIDDGLGTPARLGALVEALCRADVSAVMIEDAKFPGAGKLCEPEEMLARLAVIRLASGSSIAILARTDVLGPNWPLAESLRRLRIYLDGGADWVVAAFLRTPDEVRQVARMAAPRAMSMPEIDGIPSLADSADAGYCAALVSVHTQLHRQLVAAYSAVLHEGDANGPLVIADPWRDQLPNISRYRDWIEASRDRG